MLQRYVPYAAEAAVLYARLPGETSGRILSLTLPLFPACRRQRPHDGAPAHPQRRARAMEIRAASRRRPDPSRRRPRSISTAFRSAARWCASRLIGNQRAGALYRDGRRHITAALEARFDAIARSMTEFHYGRFDLRFETSKRLMRGEDFAIVEINGIGGEAIDCWDPRLPVTRSLPAAGRAAAAAVPDRGAQPRARLPSDLGRRFRRQPDPAEPS